MHSQSENECALGSNTHRLSIRARPRNQLIVIFIYEDLPVLAPICINYLLMLPKLGTAVVNST